MICVASGTSPDRWPTFREHEHMTCPSCRQRVRVCLRRLDHHRMAADIYFVEHDVPDVEPAAGGAKWERHAIGIDLDHRNADLARERVGMFLEVAGG